MDLQENGNIRAALSTTDVIEVKLASIIIFLPQMFDFDFTLSITKMTKRFSPMLMEERAWFRSYFMY